MRLVACDESQYEVTGTWDELAMAQQELFDTDEAITHETVVEDEGRVFAFTASGASMAVPIFVCIGNECETVHLFDTFGNRFGPDDGCRYADDFINQWSELLFSLPFFSNIQSLYYTNKDTRHT